MRDWNPEPREGCGRGATTLERETFVYPSRMFQIRVRSLDCVPSESGHSSVSKQLGRRPVRMKEEREGPVTVLHPCRRRDGSRSTALSTTDAVDIQYGACL